MIRALFLLAMAGVGTASFVIAHRLSAEPPTERIVYCPLGTTDPECVEARRLYDAGKLTTPTQDKP